MPDAGGEGRAAADFHALSATTDPLDGPGDTRNVPPAQGDSRTPSVPPEFAALLGSAPSPTSARYQIVGKIGEGGMGVVYHARDRLLERDVALKMIRPTALTEGGRRRFDAEARAVARMDHPHIIKVFDVGERPDEEGAAAPYLTLEYLPGGSLAQVLPAGPTAFGDAARLVRRLAMAVAHAHGRGVVHRDLKPGNVLLAAAADEPSLNTVWGVPKVADFGLARPVEGGDRLTHSGAVVGTPLYMAPEQADGRTDVGPPADVYALGGILFRMLAGRPPFESASLTTLLYKVVHDAPPPLTADCPAGLKRVCLECLAKDPSARPTASELARRLGEWQSATDEGAVRPAATAPTPRPRWAPSIRLTFALSVTFGCLAAFASVVMFRMPDGSSILVTPPDTRDDSLMPLEPLRVASLEVEHLRRGGAADQVLGRDSFFPTLGDQVRVRAKLSRPGYSYIIACRADGVVELCYPDAEDEVPPLTSEPCYPPASKRDKAFGLQEGVGLWVFAIFASDRPLPSYREWSAGRPAPWKSVPAPSGTVWRDDGQWVEALRPGGVVRGDRGKGETVPGQGEVVRVTDWLRAKGGAAAAVGFGVDRP